MKLKVLLALSFMIFLFACETTPPEILSVQWQINLIEKIDTRVIEENLTVFVSIADEDGVEDIETLHILHDETEQFWSFDASTWTVQTMDEEHWIGNANIVMPDRSPIPRGKYRLLIYDSAGERSEEIINLNTVVIDPKKIKFPTISAKNGIVTTETTYNNTNLVLFDRNSRFVESFLLEYDNILIERIPRYRELTMLRGMQAYLYVWLEEEGYGIMTGPKRGLYDDAMAQEE